MQYFLDGNILRRTGEYVAAGWPSGPVYKASAFEQDHDLTEVLGRYVAPVCNIFNLHGTTQLIILRQFG